MKNKVLVFIILAMLSLPVYVQAVDNLVDLEPSSIEEIQQKETLDSKEINLPPELENNNFKFPTSRKQLAKKFIIAMLSVAGSSVAIFLGLTLYNRIRESFSNPIKTPENEISLKTPDNLDSAVKTFLEKTNWE